MKNNIQTHVKIGNMFDFLHSEMKYLFGVITTEKQREKASYE
jgi:hypothetical protein